MLSVAPRPSCAGPTRDGAQVDSRLREFHTLMALFPNSGRPLDYVAAPLRQKTYLSANWITRGLTLVEVIQPPVGVLMFGNEAKVPGAIGAA